MLQEIFIWHLLMLSAGWGHRVNKMDMVSFLIEEVPREENTECQKQ